MDKLPYRPRVSADHSRPNPMTDCYMPLTEGQIRVLELEGFDDHGMLICNLKPVNLDDAQDTYTAISYVWNEEERIWYGKYDIAPQVILINGLAIEASDKVATILAMMRIRDTHTVWIDTICINQSDLNEKARQVSRMGDVYAGASEVASILGSPDKIIDAAFDLVNRRAQEPGTLADLTKAFHKVACGTLKITLNDYWYRAWILQEISKARKVVLICGTKSSTVEAFAQITSNLLGDALPRNLKSGLRLAVQMCPELFLLVLKAPYKRVFHLMRSRGFEQGNAGDVFKTCRLPAQPFLGILDQGQRNTGCRDPRDVLYALRSLASDASELLPDVDYSLPVEDLYMRFAANSVQTFGDPRIIGLTRNTNMDLPSWVPDWTVKWSGTWATAGFWESPYDMAKLSWKEEMDTPRISVCKKKLTVQVRVLYTMQRRSALSLFFNFVVAPSICLLGFGDARLCNASSERARAGDLVCLVKGFGYPLYLRPSDGHFKIVGRNVINHSLIDCPCKWGKGPWGEIKTCRHRLNFFSDPHWTMNPLEAYEPFNQIPERIFTIV